jgi:hypothetical protein
MELEFWADLSQAICDVRSRIKPYPRDVYPTALIVRVHLWAALHDRPTSWACRSGNWTRRTCPSRLPDQSTLSRRTRRSDFEPFLKQLHARLNGNSASTLLKIVDGKPLELPNHTADRDAAWGRGVRGMAIGYKLHAICSGNPLPDAFAITSLNVCEKQMASRMIRRVKGVGYCLGDGHYDASWLFEICAHHGHQLLCPRAKPGTGIGHHHQSPRRLRSIQLLEPPGRIDDFGPSLYRLRTGIERQFSQMVSFGGGLAALPPWVRRIWRVRNWVWAKLLINGARIRCNRKRGVNA